MPREKKDRARLNRRQFLQTTGLTVAAVGGMSGVSLATSSTVDRDTLRLRGTAMNPVHGRTIKQQRKASLEQFLKTTNSDQRIVLKQFSDDETNILAYNLLVSAENGVEEHVYRYSPTNEVSLSGSAASAVTSRAHSAADQWLTEGTPSAQRSNSTIQQSAGTQSSYPDWSEWSSSGSHYDVNERPPYGVVIEDYSFRSDSDGSDAMAVQTGVDIEAGYNRYQNGYDEYEQWHIKEAFVRQEWMPPTVGDEDMRDRYPRGNLDDGTVSYGVDLGIDGNGTGSVGVSYSFSKSMDSVTDESSQGDNIGRWRMSLSPYSDAAESNAYYNPGSMALVDKFACGVDSEVSVVEIPLDVEFGMPYYNTWSDTHTETFATNFSEWCY